jgi:signal transduction histidine kinase
MTEKPNRRILLIDDTHSIHQDFRKILEKRDTGEQAVDDAMAALLGAGQPQQNGHAAATDDVQYELVSALQGPEGLERVKAAVAEGRPYALAFVDVRMPPGWDGVKTIEAIWKEDAEIQTVICTAYSDYSWDQTVERLGRSDRLLILKKPFDAVEICQIALALTEKWNSVRRERALVDQLRRAEQEARSYASSLETVNRALVTAKAASDKVTRLKTDFLLHLSEQVNGNLQQILGEAGHLKAPHQQSPDGERTLDTIISASQRLMHTFNETMDIALLEAGQLTCEAGPCPVVSLLREICGDRRERAKAKGLTLELAFTNEIPEGIHTDARRFRQVVEELVDNAIHNTTRGGVRLVVSMEHTNDWQRSALRCDVIDSGCGIADDARGMLFEPFGTGRNGGSPGLGLALVKKLAEAMGGDVVVTASAPGQGTTLTLTIDAGVAGAAKVAG